MGRRGDGASERNTTQASPGWGGARVKVPAALARINSEKLLEPTRAACLEEANFAADP
jgi:hypothetical protein